MIYTSVRLGNSCAHSGMDNGEAEIEEVEFDEGLRLPGELFDRMFDYQQVCLKWLWELHTQKVGRLLSFSNT